MSLLNGVLCVPCVPCVSSTENACYLLKNACRWRAIDQKLGLKKNCIISDVIVFKQWFPLFKNNYISNYAIFP